MAGLLSLANEQLLQIGSCLSKSDHVNLALVHPILVPVAQDFLFRAVEVSSDDDSPKRSVVCMVATLLNKPGLAERVTSLKLSLTGRKVPIDDEIKLHMLGWALDSLDAKCKGLQKALLPPDMQQPFDFLVKPHIPHCENFYGGILVSLFPNLKTLDLNISDPSIWPTLFPPLEHSPYVVHRLFGWKVENFMSRDGGLKTLLDHLPCFNNLTKLRLCESNYLLLQHGFFPNLRVVEADLPHAIFWRETRLVDLSLQGRTRPRMMDTLQLPPVPGWKFPGVQSVRFSIHIEHGNYLVTSPIQEFMACFPSCNRLRVDLNDEPYFYIILAGIKRPKESMMYNKVTEQLLSLKDTLETLIFSDWDPNPRFISAAKQKKHFRNWMDVEEEVPGGIDWYGRYSQRVSPVGRELLPFTALRHLVIPYSGLIDFGENVFCNLVPAALETLEVIRPGGGFKDFLSHLAFFSHLFPNIKTLISYHGDPEDFTPRLYHTMEADDPLWKELQDAGIEYMMRPYENVDYEADRPAHIARMRELN